MNDLNNEKTTKILNNEFFFLLFPKKNQLAIFCALNSGVCVKNQQTGSKQSKHVVRSSCFHAAVCVLSPGVGRLHGVSCSLTQVVWDMEMERCG